MKEKIQQTISKLNEFMPRAYGAKFFMTGAIALALLSSCEKESQIGLDVQPEGDLLHTRTTDTVSVTTFTVKDDSIKTNQLSRSLVGSYNDPVFGYAASSIYSQFRIPTNSPDFTGATLDSIVLSLAYNGDPAFYGSISDGDMQTFKVYQVVGDISTTTPYYSNQAVDVYPAAIGSKTFNVDVIDSVLVGGKKEKPQVRIKLDPNFGNLLLNAGAANLTGNTSFLQYFKGLHIRPENGNQSTGQGSILGFNLLDGASGLTLYYKTAAEDSLSYKMIVGSGTYFSHFDHTYSSAGPIAQQLSNPALGQDLTYLQAMAGVKTKVSFPHIQHLKDSSNIVVNSAELVIKADPSFLSNDYPAPPRLFLVPVTSTGANGDLFSWADFQEGSNYYGGLYDATTKEYHFNVSRYVQSVIDGKTTDYGLYLTIAGNGVNGSRLVIGGGSNAAYGMKLNITYTKLD